MVWFSWDGRRERPSTLWSPQWIWALARQHFFSSSDPSSILFWIPGSWPIYMVHIRELPCTQNSSGYSWWEVWKKFYGFRESKKRLDLLPAGKCWNKIFHYSSNQISKELQEFQKWYTKLNTEIKLLGIIYSF